MPDLAPELSARAAALLLAAARRWLVKDELAFLLRHWRLAGVPRLSAVRLRPSSGSLAVFDAREVPDYKKDGWRWQKRKDGSGRVREDRAKLVVSRSLIVLGSYVHSADVATFHRRCYYIRDAKDSIVLVHYFDEAFKDKVASGRAPPTVRPECSIDHRPPDPKVPTLPTQPMQGDAIEKDVTTTANDTCSSLTLSATERNDCDLDMLLKEDEALEGIASDFGESMLCDDLSSPVSFLPRCSDKRVKISDFSPEWDDIKGGSKILICLASPLPDAFFDDHTSKLYVQFGRSRSAAEKLSDTVIRCTAPSSNVAATVDMYIVQSHTHDGRSEDVILSFKTRFVYRDRQETANSIPPPPILASISLISGNTAKRGRSPGGFAPFAERRNSRGALGVANLSSYVESDLDERQCKIRVVERLSEFQQAIWTRASAFPNASSDSVVDARFSSDADLHSSSTSDHCQRSISDTSDKSLDGSTQSTAGSDASLDDSTIETLSDHDLEQLSDKLLERVVRQLITLAHTSDELLEELNSLDETGLSLLHYVSFYNYAQLVPVLLAHGAHVNQQSTQGQTALHLAAGCGHDDLVAVLLESGADAHMVDFDGLTAADRAEKSGHQQVSATLRQYMAGSNSLSSPASDTLPDLQLTDCYPMEIDDDPVLYHEYQHAALWTSESSLTSPSSTLASNSPALHPASRSHASSFESGGDPASVAKGSTYYADENHEHNRKFLLGAFSTMSLHDKCALSLSISRDSNGNPRRRGSSISDDIVFPQVGSVSGLAASPVVNPLSTPPEAVGDIPSLGETPDSVYESDVKSVIAEDEESLHKLEAAIELMGPEERQSLEEEVRVLQHNVRAWLLRRNCRSMREATKRLHEATRSMENQHPAIDAAADAEGVASGNSGLFERERAAVTVQAATRSMLARRNFLQTKHVAIKVQAATRGVLCRKHFARMKSQAQASLVIQRNVREWWNKQPGARPGTIHHTIESWQERPSLAEDVEEEEVEKVVAEALRGSP